MVTRLVACCLLPFISLAAGAETPTWRLQTVDAVVDGPEIRLGDVLRLVSGPTRTNTQPVWRENAREIIAVMPAGGGPAIVSTQRLARWWRQRSGDDSRVVISGPAELRVRLASRTVAPPPAIEAHRVAPVARTVPLPPAAAAIAPLQGEAATRLARVIQIAVERELEPPDGYDWTVDGVQIRNGPAVATVRQVTGLSLEQPWPTWDVEASPERRTIRFEGVRRGEPMPGLANVELRPHPPIYVASHVIRRGEPVMPATLRAKPRATDRPLPGAITDPLVAKGREATRTLRAGEPITDDLLVPIRWVRRGELVSVRVVAGGITVSTDGKAIGDGGRDELIEVETLQPRRRLLARVTGPQVVEAVAHGGRAR